MASSHIQTSSFADFKVTSILCVYEKLMKKRAIVSTVLQLPHCKITCATKLSTSKVSNSSRVGWLQACLEVRGTWKALTVPSYVQHLKIWSQHLVNLILHGEVKSWGETERVIAAQRSKPAKRYFNKININTEHSADALMTSWY